MSKPVLYIDDNKKAFWNGLFWNFAWLTINISMTLLNKSIFVHLKFPYPVTVSLIHMFFTCTLSLLIIKIFQYPKLKSLDSNEHQKVAAFSLLFCINIVMGNFGINLTSVATSQVIRAAIPAATMILSFYLLNKRYNVYHLSSIAVVVFGVILATYGDLEFSLLGLIIQIIGCILSSLKSVTSSKFLVGYHPLDLAFRMSFYAVIQMLLLAYVLGEIAEIRDHWEEYANRNLLIAVVLNGVMAFSLNFSNFMFTKSTSALTVTVSGSVKNVLTIIISILVFNTPIAPLNGTGIVITIFGAAFYNYICYKFDAKK